MPTYFCIECGRPTRHFNIKASAEHCEVTRATIYNWIHRGLVHCVVQPSGRTFLCQESLLTPGFSVYGAEYRERSAVVPATVHGERIGGSPLGLHAIGGAQ